MFSKVLLLLIVSILVFQDVLSQEGGMGGGESGPGGESGHGGESGVTTTKGGGGSGNFTTTKGNGGGNFTTTKSGVTTTKSGVTTTKSGVTTTKSGMTTTKNGGGGGNVTSTRVSTTKSDQTTTTSSVITTEAESSETTEEGSIVTTSSSSTGFTNRTCEKGNEPSGACSLLLEVTVQTENSVDVPRYLFSIFKDAWKVVTHSSSIGYSSIDLYVEFLHFAPLSRGSNGKRLLLQDYYEYYEPTEVSNTTEQNQEMTTTSANVPTNVATNLITTEAETKTTTIDAATTATVTIATTSTYYYTYNISIAFFDQNCDTIDKWYQFFVALGNTFISQYTDNLEDESKNYTSTGFGFGTTDITSVTLSERDTDGTVIDSTTFNTSNMGNNNYNLRSIMFIVISLASICISLLL